MSKFAEFAKAKTKGGDSLFKGRDRIKTDNLIASYPDGITITEYRKLNGPSGPFWLVGFAEDPTICFSATSVLVDILEAYSAEFPSVEAASDDLKAAGGCKVKLHYAVSKSGNRYVAIDVLS